MVLVVMAAGLGSRFGGLKQIEPIDENGNFLIDYSIYDAIMAGFDEVVFVIRKENELAFKTSIGERIEKRIKTRYVFQENDEIIKNYPRFEGRTKPLGTGHVVSILKNTIFEPFAIINADDFYGRDSYMLLADYLKNNSDENTFALILYNFISSLSPSGDVKRGICSVTPNYLKYIEECRIQRKDGFFEATTLLTNEKVIIDDSTKVSMNMFGFSTKIFEFVDRAFFRFLNSPNIDPLKSEFFLPNVVSEAVKNNECLVKTIPTPSKWLGITYYEDLEFVKSEISKLVSLNVYPENLWE